MKDINEDFSWGSDLCKTSFEEITAPPIFSIVLNMNEYGPYYITDPDRFEVCILILHYFSF
jgi:hypothetical protein